MFTMLRFFLAHLPYHGATAAVLLRQAFEVIVEVLAHLLFRFRDETEAPSIAQHAAGGTDQEGACIPEWRQSAGCFAKFLKPAFAPRQVVEFFDCCFLDLRLDLVITRYCSVPLVQRLCRDFAGVVDAHESSRVPALCLVHFGIGNVSSRVRASRIASRSGDRPECIVRAREQSIERGQASSIHRA